MVMAPEGVVAFKGKGDQDLPTNFAKVQDQNVVLEQG